jgi:hypothetical protein
MTELVVQLLPEGMARAGGSREPLALHLVLTGAGGGTWDVALGERSGETAVPEGAVPEVAVVEVAVVADAVRFCRLVANRISPGELRAHVSGAVAAADRVLAGAAALALD